MTHFKKSKVELYSAIIRDDVKKVADIIKKQSFNFAKAMFLVSEYKSKNCEKLLTNYMK
jgi:hypothetical protein